MPSPTTDHRRLQIDIWSDILCPFCYLGDTLLAQALARFPHADQQEARALGVRGVPFFVLDGRYAVSGAQPVETFLKTLEAAWASMAE